MYIPRKRRNLTLASTSFIISSGSLVREIDLVLNRISRTENVIDYELEIVSRLLLNFQGLSFEKANKGAHANVLF